MESKVVAIGDIPAFAPREIFHMDLAGNRITYHGRDGSDANYASNTSNQYTHITPPDVDLTYDAAGNLTTDHRGYQFTYDHDNKLIKVLGPNMPAVTFEYDALGRRVKKTDWSGYPNVTVRYYVSSSQNELTEYDAQGTRLRYYVHGPTYIDERVILHDDATNKDYVYLLKDLYTVAGLADQRGWPVEYYDYDAYGTVHMYRCAMLPFAADLDGDGDVDNDDLPIFKSAYDGPGNEPNGSLGWLADLDGDGDVDGSDYVRFAHAWNGSGNTPRDPNTPFVMLGSMPTSRMGNSYFFTGRRLDVFDISDNGTPHHFTDDCAGHQIYDFRRRINLPDWGRFGQADPSGSGPMPIWQGPVGSMLDSWERIASSSRGLIRSALGPTMVLRWISEGKPETQYKDGMGLYEYVGGNPAAYVDPLGLDRWIEGTLHHSIIYQVGKCCYKVDMAMATNPVNSIPDILKFVGSFCANGAFCVTVGGCGKVRKEKVPCPTRPPDIVSSDDEDQAFDNKWHDNQCVYYNLWFRNCNNWVAVEQNACTGHGMFDGLRDYWPISR